MIAPVSRKPHTIPLNSLYLKDYISKHQIKRDWLACIIGVTSRSLRRWLNGEVKFIKEGHFNSLVDVIGQEHREALILQDRFPLGTGVDQAQAANHLSQMPMDHFAPLQSFSMMESLLKATMRPDLSDPMLSELYSRLSMACLRQQKFTDAKRYALNAIHLCKNQSNHPDQHLHAQTRLAAVEIFLAVPKSIQLMQSILESPQIEHIPHIKGRNLANLGLAYQRTGQLDESRGRLMEAIRFLENKNFPEAQVLLFNSYNFLIDTLTCSFSYPLALDYCEKAIELAKVIQLNFQVHKINLRKALIYALLGKKSLAQKTFDAHISAALGSVLVPCDVIKAIGMATMRILGQPQRSLELAIQTMPANSEEACLYGKGLVTLESAWSYQLLNDPRGTELEKQALIQFKEVDATPVWIEDLTKAPTTIGFSKPLEAGSTCH